MIYGHRRDPVGYHKSVAETDAQLEPFLKDMKSDDLLILTADHGCDPTFRGTDHTREHVPLLVYQPGAPGRSLGIRNSFADLAQSLAKWFKTPEFTRDGKPVGVAFL